MLSSIIVGVTGFVVVTVPGIDAALAGVALTFAMSVTGDVGSSHLALTLLANRCLHRFSS
jgi:hypothetical protein